MAIKKITATYDTAKSLLVTVIDDTTGQMLDDADGAFRAEASVADEFVALVEHFVANGFDSDLPGLYEVSENRAPWPDGNKTLLFREVGSDNVIGSDRKRTMGDAEVDFLFDANGYIKSAPQTAVTVSPAQVLGGALQPFLPIRATATIEAPQGDAYPIPFAIGSTAAKAGAKFLFQAGTIDREITIADPDNVAGMIVLTALETATKESHPARVLRVDADGVSNPLTVWKGKLNIITNVG